MNTQILILFLTIQANNSTGSILNTVMNGSSRSQEASPSGQAQSSGSRQHSPAPTPSSQRTSSPSVSASLERQSAAAAALTSEYLRHSSTPTAFRPPHELPSPFFANSNGIFRPGFPAAYTPPAHHHSPVMQHSQMAAHMQNGAFRK